ncbi:MAG: choice-of-anchor Q domain-containing protein [Thermomicrobiales bacterium]
MRQVQCAFRGLGGLLVALLLLSALPAVRVFAAPIVSTCADSGAGSLRAAIAANPGTITFGVNCQSGAGQITLASTLTIANDLTIDATGHTIVVDGGCTANCGTGTATSGTTVFHINLGVTATLNGLTIQHGNGTADSNGSSRGGGIYNRGMLTVTNSTLYANSATTLGQGGGIYNNGTLVVMNSTFAANSALYGGGGIRNVGMMAVTNSTFSGNSTALSVGAGIQNDATLTLTNSTVSGNHADDPDGFGGGGINTANIGSLVAINTLIAGNTTSSGIGPDVKGTYATGSKNNLLGIASGALGISDGDANHNIVGHPALVDTTLRDNGTLNGTQTLALLTGSPAIDHGDLATCLNTSGIAPVAGKDQRGIARPQPAGGQCDIGAFELMPAAPAPLPPSQPTGPPASGGPPTPLPPAKPAGPPASGGPPAPLPPRRP